VIAGNYFKAKSHAFGHGFFASMQHIIFAFPAYRANQVTAAIYAHTLAVQSWMRLQIHFWLVN